MTHGQKNIKLSKFKLH